MSTPTIEGDTYEFFDALVVRMPALALWHLKHLNREALSELLPSLSTPLYLASPQLFSETEKLAAGRLTPERAERIFRTLYKYLSRMTTRSTPFGAFSGVMLLKWGAQTNLVRQPDLLLDTKADGLYVSALANYLESSAFMQPHLLYFTNPTCLVIGGQVRYFEYHLLNHTRRYEAAAVEAMPLLLALLDDARDGQSFRELVLRIIAAGFEEDEATGFIKELISSRLLLSELENPIVGKHHLADLTDRVTRIAQTIPTEEQVPALLTQLVALQRALEQATSHRDYEALQRQMRSLLPTYAGDSYFLVNANIAPASPASDSLGKQWQKPLLEALKIFNHFQHPVESALAAFVLHFTKRYGDASVPLLQATDVEAGIPYGDVMRTHNTPLIDDLPFLANAIPQPRRSQVAGTSTLQQLWKQNKLAGLQSLEIPSAVVEGMSPNWEDLPSTLYGVFRLVPGESEQSVLVERFNGPTAANYITRFGHSQPAIAELAGSVHMRDQLLHPNALIAEVAHLPLERASNVMSAPASSSHTISVISNTLSKDSENVDLSDLYLAVRHGRLVLFSRKLKKEVIPRLNNAYIYSRSTLPVFQLLCDLQNQNKRNYFYFSPSNLGLVDSEKFTPRITYQNLILSPAIWTVSAAELSGWSTAPSNDLLPLADALRRTHQLPQRVFLLDGDNELFIDWENELSLLTVAHEAKKHTHLRFMEAFLDEAAAQAAATDSTGKEYNAQFIALLHRTVPNPYPTPDIETLVEGINDSTVAVYPPFTQWQYYKFYCGEVTAEQLLRECIPQLVEDLQARSLIDQWFFLRYADPDFHLRIRFHIVSPAVQAAFQAVLTEHLTQWKGLDLVWNIQVDTYKRELARYSFRHIASSEHIFFRDSEATLAFLTLLTANAWPETARWFYAARSVDSLLSNFNFTMAERLELVKQLRDDFNTEFAVNASMASSITDKYRVIRNEFMQALTGEEKLPDYIESAVALLTTRNQRLQTEIAVLCNAAASGTLKLSLPQLVSSHIHMLLNRIFQAQPRQHEMVFYNFLFSSYKTIIILTGRQEAAVGSVETHR